MLHCITHWPFCPGVFIAILGLLAASVTFWERPPVVLRVLCTGLFFSLMLAEIWMMSEDRDAHDKAEKMAQENANHISVQVDYLAIEAQKSEGQLTELKTRLANTRDPREGEALRAKLKEFGEKANSDFLAFMIASAPALLQRLRSLADEWNISDDRIQRNYARSAPAEDSGRKKSLEIDELNLQLTKNALPTIVMANSLREALLSHFPDLKAEDNKQADAVFAEALAGQSLNWVEMETISSHMTRLVRKSPIVQLSAPTTNQ